MAESSLKINAAAQRKAAALEKKKNILERKRRAEVAAAQKTAYLARGHKSKALTLGRAMKNIGKPFKNLGSLLIIAIAGVLLYLVSTYYGWFGL